MTSNTSAPRDVDVAQAERLMEAGAVLLDVREQGEWDSGHADKALHVPLGQLQPTAFPTDSTIVAVCRSGNRSSQAASILAAAGLDVVNLEGGMKAWARAGLPVVRNDGQQGSV